MRTWIVLLLGIVSAPSVSAWDRVGHFVVDAIAWEHMSEGARVRAVELLRGAPADADLSLFPLAPRELFLRAGYWPDVMRDEAWPDRREKYHHSTWHYVNYFWRDGELLPEMGTNGELIDRLNALKNTEPDGIGLAWLLHLVGDIHQPLHSSARVTDLEPEGDRGGNDFLLDDVESWGNLHAFWDSIQVRARRKRHSEGDDAWINRVAQEVMTLHSRASLEDEVDIDELERWSEAGAEIAMSVAYPDYLFRGSVPTRRYQDAVQEVADRQLALAGYRLAALLDELLD